MSCSNMFCSVFSIHSISFSICSTMLCIFFHNSNFRHCCNVYSLPILRHFSPHIQLIVFACVLLSSLYFPVLSHECRSLRRLPASFSQVTGFAGLSVIATWNSGVKFCRYEWLRYFAIQSKNVKPSSHKKTKKNIHMPLMFHSKITFIYMPLIELCIYLYIYNKFDHPSIFQLFSPSYFIDLPLLHPAPHIFLGRPGVTHLSGPSS